MKMTKRLLSILLSLALLLGLMMGMSTTVYADIPQSGSNEYVGYRASSNGFDVYGKTNEGAEISTTFSNGGYKTVMQVGASVSLDFSDFAFGKEYSSDDVNASITASVSGKSVFVAYELKNKSTETKTVKIGSWADSQIKGDDSAPCSFTENGIKMTSIDGKTQFQLIPGGGNFTTRWYGYYGDADDNVFNNQIDTSTYTGDSGIAWSWTIDIQAGATVTKTAELTAAEAKKIIYDANGGTGNMDPTVSISGKSVKLDKNAYTKENSTFQGWDTNSAGTTVVYADEATLTMPDTDTTLYAVWKENREITAAAEGFEGAYDGKEHGITVTVTDPSSGATIKYGKTAGTYDLDASPTITNVVDSPLTVYFKVTADGYKDYTGSATVTINKANAVPATVTANNRTYDGAEKSLVTVDDSTLDGGTMQYALGENGDTAPESGWIDSIPEGIEAKTYYVWYKAVGDENYTDSDPEVVSVIIAEPDTYTVTVTNDGHGTGTATPASGVEGTEVTLAAAAAEGYQFKEWQVVSGGVTVTDNKFVIGTANVEIKAIFEKEESGEIDAEIESEPGAPEVDGNIAEVATGVVTEEEIAAGVKVWVEITPLDESAVTDDVKTVAAEALETIDGKPGIWLDMSMFKQVVNGEKQTIHQTATGFKFTIKVPETLKKDGRTYYLVRIHNGEAKILAETDGDVLSGETDKFSAYLIAYKDAPEPTATPTVAPTPTPTPKPTATPKPVPKTGDGAPLALWIGLILVGVVCLGVFVAKLRGTQKK